MVAELAKSFGGQDKSTEIYLLKSPKAYAASATQEPQLLGLDRAPVVRQEQEFGMANPKIRF